MAKTTRVKKPKKKLRTLGNMIKDADAWFSRWIRLSYSDAKGYATCISCEARLHWKEMHNCHFIKRSNYFYRRSEENCRPGCNSCNTYRTDFHYMVFTIKMIKQYGLEYVDKMRATKWELRKIKRDYVQEIIDKYKEKVKNHILYLEK